LAVLSAIAAVAGAIASVAVIDSINTAIHRPQDRAYLLLVFIGLNAATIVLKNSSSLLPAYATMKIVTALRIALCRRILRTALEDIDRRGAANFLTLLTNDIPTISRTLLMLPSILSNAAIFIFGVAYLAHFSWMVFVLTVAALAFAVALHSLLAGKAVSFSRETRNEINTFDEHTHGLIFGIKELQLNGERRRWFRRDGIDGSSQRIARYAFIEQVWFAAGSSVAPAAVALLLGILIFGIAPLQFLDTSTLSACILAFLYIVGPVGVLISAIPQLGQGTIACERLAAFGFSFDGDEADLVDPEPAELHEQPALRNWKSIALCGVRTRYCDGTSSAGFELGPIDLRVHPGELVFVVGGNGSGKSTLAKILTGLYVPLEGQVFLDGQPVNEQNREAYRSLFSAVFTDFHVFNRLFGAGHDAPIDLAHKYLVLLGLADKVQIADQSYSTTKALSHGQRKRLALLCAYLEDRMVYVLDEWAADQDPSFKKFFYEALLPDLKRRGKCVVIVTHDDQYFERADRIIKLSDGRIASDMATQTSCFKTA
jgi:putative ATP-binding cassette transporter